MEPAGIVRAEQSERYVYHKSTGEYKGEVHGCDFEKDGASGGYLNINLYGCDIEEFEDAEGDFW